MANKIIPNPVPGIQQITDPDNAEFNQLSLPDNGKFYLNTDRTRYMKYDIATGKWQLVKVGIGGLSVIYDFNDGTLQGWTPILGTWTNPGTVLSGTGDGTDAVENNATVANAYTDYMATLVFKHISGSTSGMLIGFITRWVNFNNAVVVFFDSSSNIIFAQVVAGTLSIIASTAIAENITDGLYHTLQVIDTGSNFKAILDGNTYINMAYSSTVPTGTKGIVISGNRNFHTDNVNFTENSTPDVVLATIDDNGLINGKDLSLVHAPIASGISVIPSGNIISTDVQSAINEIDTEKYAKTGGTLTGDVNVSKTSPEIKLTETGDGSTTRLKKVAVSHLTTLYDKVIKAAGIGGALSFNGGFTQYVEITDSLSLSPTTEAAFEIWVNLASMGGAAFATKGTQGVDFTWSFGTDSGGHIYVFIANSLTDIDNNYLVSTLPLVSIGNWAHLKFVFDGTGATNSDRLKLFKGNNLSSVNFVGTIPSSLTNSSAPLLIGSRLTNLLRINGNLDEAVYFNTADTSDGYNAGAGVYHTPAANIVGIWHFDEGSGITATDSSGNGNHGTLVNGVAWNTGVVSVAARIVEVGIMESEDGTAINEEGKTYWGHCNGGTALRGKTIKKCISGVETDLTGIINNDTITLPSDITVGASPFTYQAGVLLEEDIIITGGTVSDISFSRDDSTYYTTGLIAGMFKLSPNDYLKITYSSVPVVTKITR